MSAGAASWVYAGLSSSGVSRGNIGRMDDAAKVVMKFVNRIRIIRIRIHPGLLLSGRLPSHHDSISSWLNLTKMP
jgi:hypothetical protein